MRSGVDGLHAQMGFEGALVIGCDNLFRCGNDLKSLGVFLRDQALFAQHLCGIFRHALAAGFGRLTKLPFNGEHSESVFRLVPRGGHNSDGILHIGLAALAFNRAQLHHSDKAGLILNRIGIKALELAPWNGRRLHSRIDHAGQTRINGILSAAIDLIGNVEALCASAQQPPLRGIFFDRGFFIECDFSSGRSKLRIGCRV